MKPDIMTKAEVKELTTSRTFAILRPTLVNSGLTPPTSDGFVKINFNQPHRVIQPDRLDSEEFNMIMYIPADMQNTTGISIRVQSIDFDFLSQS